MFQHAILRSIFISWALLSACVWAEEGDHHQASESFQQVQIKPDFYMLTGKGGNILVSTGEQGLLLVDTDYQEMSDALTTALSHWKSPVTYVLNTHWHFDHTGGNSALGGHALIIAHDTVRELLSKDRHIDFFAKTIPATDESGLPDVTFSDNMTVYFNGTKFQLMHLPGGHTDGDVVVLLKELNMIHMGDLFFNGIFPFVDVQHGGRVNGLIKNIDRLLSEIDEDTVIIPGHGPLADRDGLIRFRDMLTGTYDEVNLMFRSGKDLQEMQSIGLNSRWSSWEGGFLNEAAWIQIIHDSIMAERSTSAGSSTENTSVN